MGAYFLVVNPAKRQYLNPARSGDAIKFRSVLEGGCCIRALKILIADNAASNSSTASFWSAWFGDAVILAGDDGGPPNPRGFTTATPERPWRNLKSWRKKYDQIARECPWWQPLPPIDCPL